MNYIEEIENARKIVLERINAMVKAFQCDKINIITYHNGNIILGTCSAKSFIEKRKRGDKVDFTYIG